LPSISPLPLSDLELRRAAEEIIAEHGDVALTQAEEHVRALTAEGFDSIAKTWERIADAIREMQRTKTGRAEKRYIMEVFGKGAGVLIAADGAYVFHAALPEARSLDQRVFRSLEQAEKIISQQLARKRKPT